MGFKALPTLISLFIGLLIWFVVPVPSGVDPNAWHLLAMCVGVIAAIDIACVVVAGQQEAVIAIAAAQEPAVSMARQASSTT